MHSIVEKNMFLFSTLCPRFVTVSVEVSSYLLGNRTETPVATNVCLAMLYSVICTYKMLICNINIINVREWTARIGRKAAVALTSPFEVSGRPMRRSQRGSAKFSFFRTIRNCQNVTKKSKRWTNNKYTLLSKWLTCCRFEKWKQFRKWAPQKRRSGYSAVWGRGAEHCLGLHKSQFALL